MSRRSKPRNTAKYKIIDKKTRRVLYSGITDRELKFRLSEHKAEFGPNIRIKQIGRRTTREAALEWERYQRTAPESDR